MPRESEVVKTTIGDRFKMFHPRVGREDVFEVISIADGVVKMRAQGAGYWSDVDRIVERREEELASHRPALRPPIAEAAGRPQNLAKRMRDRRIRQKLGDGFLRETFTLPVDEARDKARELLERYPAAAYMTCVESWCQLPDGGIKFTMRRLPTAD